MLCKSLKLQRCSMSHQLMCSHESNALSVGGRRMSYSSRLLVTWLLRYTHTQEVTAVGSKWEKCEHTDPHIHTHTHTPSRVPFPSNTKPWLFVQSEREGEKEREGECEGVCVWGRDTNEGVVKVWESDRRRRETEEERSTCQSGWALNFSKRVAEWVQTARLHTLH